MNKIKRYRINTAMGIKYVGGIERPRTGGIVVEHPEGDWVKWADVAELLQQVGDDS